MKALLVLAAVALAAAGCHDKRPAEGPAEYSGRKVDETAHKAKDDAKSAGHDVKCGAKNAKDDAKDQPRDPNCH